ncbi:MAG: hypothetical protein WD065_12745 [Planctomycetaceae bacterium]
MYALRCTQKLQRRLGCPLSDASVPASTRLGDWYANLLIARPMHLVLCVSERSLLPVVVEARDPSGFPRRLAGAVRSLLLSIGVSPAAAEREETEMLSGMYVAKTANKSILGSLNDFMFHLKTGLAEHPSESLLDRSLRMATIPCNVIGFKYPSEVAHEIIASAG